MITKNSKIPFRLTISLGNTHKKLLDEIMEKNNIESVSAIIREALELHHALLVQLNFKRDIEDLKNWVTALSTGEHLIVDMEHWSIFCEMVSTLPQPQKENIIKKFEDSGVSHGVQYLYRKINSTEKILRNIERANWYIIQKESDAYILLLKDPRSSDIVEAFLRGIFKAQEKNVQITKGIGKLIVIDNL